jgi:hypothetical protein
MARVVETRNTYRIFVGKPLEKLSLERLENEMLGQN